MEKGGHGHAHGHVRSYARCLLLDTNIISEMMKSSPDRAVINWMDQQEIAELFVSAITIAEISYGLNAASKNLYKSTHYEEINRTLAKQFC